MDLNTVQYTVVQKLRCHHWANRKNEPSQALIQLLPQGVRILLSVIEGNTIVAFDEIQFTKELAKEEQIAQFKGFVSHSVLAEAAIKSVIIAVEPRYFTVLPEHLFSIENAALYLESLCEVPYAQTVMFEKTSQDMVLIYSVPQVWLEWAHQVFSPGEISWTCSLSGMMEYGLSKKDRSGREAFAQIDPKSVFAMGFEDGNLLFANQFQFKTENDLLYYLLLVIHELEMEPEQATIWLSGSILSGSSGFEKLNRYFGNLNFIHPARSNHEIFEEELLFQPLYFDLICLHQKQIQHEKNRDFSRLI